MMTETGKTLIIAYGNRDREDDGAGWHMLNGIASQLGLPTPQKPGEWVETADHAQRLLYLFQLLPEMAEDLVGFDCVYFLDAHNSPSLDSLVIEEVLPAPESSAFTHHMSISELLNITHSVYGRHPKSVVVSVRGHSFSFRDNLTPKTQALVLKAVGLLAKAILGKQPAENFTLERGDMSTSQTPYVEMGIWQYSRASHALSQFTKPVVSEHALELIVNDESWLTFICSPVELKELAVGFLWNEGVIQEASEIKDLVLYPDYQKIMVSLDKSVTKPSHFHRTTTGIALDNPPSLPALPTTSRYDGDFILEMYDRFSNSQTLHEAVGGFHSAALTDDENIQYVVEDLGRHNCIDKLAGKFLLAGKSFTPAMLMLSGRISSEMVLKSLTMGTPMLVSRTSPTALAVSIAQQVGMTLIGYLRRGQYEIYCNPQRIHPK